jgi:uncharacterized membrane protein YdjX (TVP38/TMEM64 family)
MYRAEPRQLRSSNFQELLERYGYFAPHISFLLNSFQTVLNFLPQAEATIMATSAWRKSSKVGGGAEK